MSKARRGSSACCMWAVSLVLALPAFPQGALDAGLQVGGKANAAAKQEDFRSRNLVVTGDVAAGRGFRGSVGYTAEGDFRGATGGDVNVDFRRNSALSNPALATGSVGAGASFSIGRDSVSSLEYRRDYVGPSGSGAASSTGSSASVRERLDRMSTRLSSSQMRGLEGESTPMARYQGREGDQGVLSVSEVRGVKKERDRDQVASERLSLYEAARLREDLRSGLLRMDAVRAKSSNPFVTQAPTDAVTTSSVRDIAKPTRGESASRPLDTGSTQYDGILREMKENWRRRGERAERAEATADTTDLTGMAMAYERLRKDLGAPEAPSDEATDGKDPALRVKPVTAASEPARIEVSGVKMTLDDYAMLLKHGGRVDAFGDGGVGRIDELLVEGQRAMHEGNSFVAEKRFEVALAMKPGDPRVQAGLLHCQIGANLAGSAAITLRSLLASHPEMMDVRYGDQALPPRDRIERAMVTASERLKAGQRPVDDGLLLAYLGHLLGDSGAIRSGLAAVQGSPENDTLRQLLEKLWLAADAKPGIESGADAARPAETPNP